MASMKVQKPAVATSLVGKKEASKVGETAASKGSMSAPKKAAASKPKEPKKKVCLHSNII